MPRRQRPVFRQRRKAALHRYDGLDARVHLRLDALIKQPEHTLEVARGMGIRYDRFQSRSCSAGSIRVAPPVP